MPADIKPLFRPAALRPKLSNFLLPQAVDASSGKLANWAALLDSAAGQKKKETELLGDFVRDVFGDLLGYVAPPADPYTLKREALVKVDGKFADAGFGRFAGEKSVFVAVLEGKGPLDPLDRPHGGRKRSAVEQALQYAVQLQIDWYLVTNLREIRLYHKGHDTFTCESFNLAQMATQEADLKRFVYLLGADRLLGPSGNHLDALLSESKKIGQQLTNDFYREYRQLREGTFEQLRAHNAAKSAAELLAATQKLLDRVLFIAFCEDRGLLPKNIISRAYEHSDPFHPKPIWQNFVALFRAVDQGNKALDIWRYNGGLFGEDKFLEGLSIPDPVCEGFKKLADYEYSTDPLAEGKLIDVEILGHIFEQSISDLEEMQNKLAGRIKEAKPKEQKQTTRKETGAFYTPEFITRYIVAETLGPVLAARFQELRAGHEAEAEKPAKKVFADPAAFDPDKLTKPQSAALIKFWDQWIETLSTIRIVDPACGSGAFLIEAFDQMFAAYQKAQGHLEALEGKTLFDIRKTILERNLYGVDLNGQAVEIARLSCWIKTAELGKVLTSLDHNIIQGNSVVAPPTPLAAWQARFPDVFKAGGFDVVIGNPPYVRQEWIKNDKPFLEQHYQAYDGVADLYVYFYELGLMILREGGRLGFVVTNKWMKAGYGEPLRKLYGAAAWVEQVIDFGHAKQIFPDADVFPSIVVVRKPAPVPAPKTARVCVIPRDLLRIDDLSHQIRTEGVNIPRTRFGPDPWNLEPPGVAALMAKLKAKGIPLKEFAGVSALYGIKTGFNEAYFIDTPTKDKLVNADPKSASLFKSYLRGQDIDRWHAEWSEMWMVVMKSCANCDWPWKGSPDAESVFGQSYPALHAHFVQYRDELKGRQDQGENWWELRSCAFWDAFAAPKIWFQQIQFHPCYAFDSGGLHGNNKTTFLPSSDLYLLGVLNSPAMWWHNYGFLPHMKDEALATVVYKMDELPIPKPTAEVRISTETAVRRLITLTAEQQSGRRDLFNWLRVEFGIEKPSQKLQGVAGLSAVELIAEVKKLRGKKQPLSVADVKRLGVEHGTSIAPLQELAREAHHLERQVSDLVNTAFDLTPAEIQLMWATAPPRMPVAPVD